MKLNCTFYRPETVNTKEFCNIVGKLRADLHALETEKHDEWDVYTYVRILTAHANHSVGREGMAFFELHDPKTMPHDARVEFCYVPTYVATALLMKAVLLYPSLLNADTFLMPAPDFSAEAVRKTLAACMLACTGRNFDGAGAFSADACIQLFNHADAQKFLHKYPDLCPAFTTLFTKLNGHTVQ